MLASFGRIAARNFFCLRRFYGMFPLAVKRRRNNMLAARAESHLSSKYKRLRHAGGLVCNGVAGPNEARANLPENLANTG